MIYMIYNGADRATEVRRTWQWKWHQTQGVPIEEHLTNHTITLVVGIATTSAWANEKLKKKKENKKECRGQNRPIPRFFVAIFFLHQFLTEAWPTDSSFCFPFVYSFRLQYLNKRPTKFRWNRSRFSHIIHVFKLCSRCPNTSAPPSPC